MDKARHYEPLTVDDFLAAVIGKPRPGETAAFASAILGKDDRRETAAIATALLGEEDHTGRVRSVVDVLREFNPDEPRDWRGRWTTGGSEDLSSFEVCFACGTPVVTADGRRKSIEEIQAGELVLSVSDADPEGKAEAKPVIRAYHNKPQPLVELHLSNELIRATPNHPFYVRGRGWTPVTQLNAGDQFRGHDRQWVELSRKATTETVEPVFNLQVADHHTYFVGKPDGPSAILVHNQSKPKVYLYGKPRVTGSLRAGLTARQAEKVAKAARDWANSSKNPNRGVPPDSNGKATMDLDVYLDDDNNPIAFKPSTKSSDVHTTKGITGIDNQKQAEDPLLKDPKVTHRGQIRVEFGQVEEKPWWHK